MAKYPYRCPECGTEVILRQRVTQTKRKCSYCGIPITTAAIDRQAQEKVKQQAITFLIIIGIAVIIAYPPIVWVTLLIILLPLIGIICLGIKKSKTKKNTQTPLPIEIARKSNYSPINRVSPNPQTFSPHQIQEQTRSMPILTQRIGKVTKPQAIAIVNKQKKQSISNKTTIFANINKAKSVYWFDIPLKRLNSKGSLNILTYDHQHEKLYYLEVPHTYFTENISLFYVRQDKQAISLELDATIENQFQDVRTGSKKSHFRGFIKDVYDCSSLTSEIIEEDDKDEDDLDSEDILSSLYGEAVHLIGSHRFNDDDGNDKDLFILREIRRGYYLEMLVEYTKNDLSNTSTSHRVLPSFLPLLENKEKTWKKFTKKASDEDWLALDEIMLNTVLFSSSHVLFAGADLIGPDVADEAFDRFGCYYPDEDLLPVFIFENTDYQLRLFIPSDGGNKFASDCAVGDEINSRHNCFSSLKKAQEFLDQRLSYYIQES
jgi:uncharacterized protein (DUF983 family)